MISGKATLEMVEDRIVAIVPIIAGIVTIQR